MAENTQTTSQDENRHAGKGEGKSCKTTFEQYILLPEVNKTTISIYGSTSGVRKEITRACKQKTGVIHPYSTFRKYWLVLVILATFGSVVAIPLSVSFFNEAVYYSPVWISLNVVVDILFIVDLCLNFRIGYWSSKNNHVVLEPQKIRNHYLKTWFIPDLLAVLPIDYLILITKTFGHSTTNIASIRVVKLLKLTRLFSLLRLLRFSRLLRYVQDLEEVHGWDIGGIATVIQFLHMVVLIVLICHWSACFHFMVANVQDFPDNSWITREGLQNKTMSLQYTRCMFRSLCHMMTLNYGSTGVPKGLTQLWVDIMSMMVGTVMYALVLARITALVTNARASENVYQSRYSEVCQYVSQYRLPVDLHHRCLEHLSSRYHGKWFDEPAILMEFNEPLRRAVLNFNCSHLLKNHPVFKDADPFFISEVVELMEFEYYMPGDIIIRREAIADCMYFIEKGDVEVKTPDVVKILSDTDFFGELCLVTDMNKRQATVKALTPCRLYSLSVANYKQVSEYFSELLQGD